MCDLYYYNNKILLSELGKYPVDINIKCRLLSYWYKLIMPENKHKLSSIIYWLNYRMFTQNKVEFKYMSSIKNILNSLGLSGIWDNQTNLNFPLVWFQEKVKRSLCDQYIQLWFSEISYKDIFWNYRIYKNMFLSERYLSILRTDQALLFLKFRTLNNNLPVQKERFVNTSRAERVCTKCNMGEVGNEYHYIFIFNFF